MMSTAGAARSSADGSWGDVLHAGPVALTVVVPGQHAVLTGRLDVLGAAAVRERLHQLVSDAETHDVVVDVAGAAVGDATGLGLLVGLHQRARLHGRTLVLLDVAPQLDSLLRHTRLRRVLTLRQSA